MYIHSTSPFYVSGEKHCVTPQITAVKEKKVCKELEQF